MKFNKGAVCELKPLRNCTRLCVLLALVLLLYYDPFLLLWWPQQPVEKPKTVVLSLDMATDSIDDMYDGCRAEAASMIDLFGVFEWHVNKYFSYAWASAEINAKKPVHKHLKEDHAIVLYMYTRVQYIQQGFDKAVQTGKHRYSTRRFMFHYFYFYLTDAIQLLRHNQTACRTTYYRTWKQFDQHVINTNMRFGSFTWVASSKQSFDFNGNMSCFEINSCFGADITYYSAAKQMGQVLIPPYEVFKITDVLTDDPWCNVVYKLQSTKIPRRDLNCKLNPREIDMYFGVVLDEGHSSSTMIMLVFAVLLIIIFLVLMKHKQQCFVFVVLGAMLVLVIILMIFKVTH